MQKNVFPLGKSLVMFGPSGCGKTRNASAIATHFGLVDVLDNVNAKNEDVKTIQGELLSRHILVIVRSPEDALAVSRWCTYAKVGSFEAVMQRIAEDQSAAALAAINAMKAPQWLADSALPGKQEQ